MGILKALMMASDNLDPELTSSNAQAEQLRKYREEVENRKREEYLKIISSYPGTLPIVTTPTKGQSESTDSKKRNRSPSVPSSNRTQSTPFSQVDVNYFDEDDHYCTPSIHQMTSNDKMQVDETKEENERPQAPLNTDTIPVPKKPKP